MGRVFIDESTLTAIGDAIRNKTGGEDLISPGNFAYEITNLPTGGGEAPEPIVLTANCAYMCQGDMGGNYLNMFGDTVSTSGINTGTYMFYNNTASKIPFNINFNSSDTYHYAECMFKNMKNLTEAPKVYNLKPFNLFEMFSGCRMLRNFPANYAEDWDWSYLNKQTNQYNGKQQGLFTGCYSLRAVPMALINNHNPAATSSSYVIYNYAFCNCYCLDEVVDMPVLQSTLTSNCFLQTFYYCNRLKRFTFATDNGTPYTANWKNQTIDLSQYVGFASKQSNILNYNSGITEDKRIYNKATYNELKDDEDSYVYVEGTNLVEGYFSRYNHDSAVETLRSLPDTSAYGTNTIKFLEENGRNTDAGAIETLTEEEIAIAAVKGWTIALVSNAQA